MIIYLKRPKEKDIYQIAEQWRQRHFNKTGEVLDINGVQGVPITPSLTLVHLPNESITAFYENNRIKGKVFRHLFKAVREQEKSRLFSESIKYSGAESMLKSAAENLNIDLESLGLE